MFLIADSIYNIVLLVIFTVVMSFAACLYVMQKKPIYKPIIVLFLFYLLDTIIIYMTEIIPVVADWYNKIFMSVPTFKTIIYLVSAFCLFQLRNRLLSQRFPSFQAAVLVFLGLWFLFIPMMDNSALKVWLYYFAYQVFTFFFSLFNYRAFRKSSIVSDPLRRSIMAFLKLTLLFSVLIAVEDSIVIFNMDIYSGARVYMHDRNHCEDVLRICYAVIILRTFYKEQMRPLWSSSRQTPAPSVSNPDGFAVRSSQIDRKALSFAQDLHLTEREAEILYMLLESANNQEISQRLYISIGTVKTHVHNIFQKAEVIHRQELISKYQVYTEESPQ